MKKRPPLRRKYKNRNRRWDTRQNTFAISLKTTAVLVLLALLGVSWLVVRHANENLADGIAREESRQRALMEELQRETAKWNQRRTPENLREQLLRNGIAMTLPSRRQIVAMRGPAARPAVAGSAPTAYASNR